ncbi:Exocyst complex component 5 Exocyst complex component Sec10 [Larimichthys crocea]|uniref:Exocyst complex component 5 n=1 Tax=Larimichthys crocea TaxID=215358 RepID=A0A6G0IF21_LARCR|nr:exocyst complex component 5 [Larimichthys crocea]KAE8289871.1 Exocyst complex component 5 Exocyst complex component Sec10 [Larimichthys crocea]
MATTAQLFEEPFDADEYIERLAWRTPGGGSKGGAEAFDPKRLLEEFENHIEELKQLDEKIQRRVEKLEHQCHREAKEFAHKVQDLQRSNQVAFQHFQELDEHISYVATKVCHLGDQLEGVNTPRQRAVEAQRLMTYFNEFLDGDLRSDVFNNPDKIKEAADIIQKLHLIAQELPFDRFADVKAKIASKYHDLERQLIQEFTVAQRRGEIGRMREVAAVLLHFKGYAHCVDVYIKQCQEGAYIRNDVFEDTAVLCQRVNKQVGEVFSSPETVMAKLIQNIFENKLQAHVREKLDETRHSDVEQYLKNLYDLYTRTTALATKLTEFNLGSDKHTFLSKLIKSIFSSYLESYIDMEREYLRTRGAMILQRYYDSKNHQKRLIGTGSIQELKERIRQRTNLPLGPIIDTHGETFLSPELVVNLLQETRHAFERCHRLSDPSDLPKNAFSIFLLLVDHLCVEHIDYALEIGLSAIPSPDAKNANLYFLDVVQQANSIFHLFDKQFNDQLMPLISSSPKLAECLQKKKEVIEQMEVKLDTGIDRTINCMVGQMKHILATEQKKTDFRPEDENNVMIQYTAACSKVCAYVSRQVEHVRKSMDGKNVDTVLTELGVRFHRLIHEHLQQYSYSSMGGMLAICDVAEYRRCAKDFRVPLVLQLFDTLHALCNLLVVAPDNLKQVCSGEQLTNLDRNLLHAFVQLRVDYRSARLGRHFS